MNIPSLIDSQRTYFTTGKTIAISSRIQVLKKLYKSVKKNEEAIHKALYSDFKKPIYESISSETGIVYRELRLAIKELEFWARPKKVKGSLLNFPSKDYLYYEPYGTTLIIAPWNYPYQLALTPLIGAIAAGNTVVIKPSELTPATSQVIEIIISEVFTPEYIAVVQGAIPETTELLAQRWDYIFFTGSVFVGKIVAQAAAKHLTPTTLELGGKNPCVIDASVNIALVAKRIVWGKFLNAGQTCVAPDYILIDASIKDSFLKELEKEIALAYGKDPSTSPDFARIINEKNFDRLTKMLEDAPIAFGGKIDRNQLYIAPTIIDNPSIDSFVMEDEIFGPILPVIPYQTKADIEAIIDRYEKPLSGYIFSRKRSFTNWFLSRFSFGGGAVNDTVIQFANEALPFGGVGHSGVGSYHGKHTFLTFSHTKAIVKKGNWLDLPVRYAPYKGKNNLLKAVLKWL
ncbi:aldehyde dehydrogenase [Dokdonia pacifica]|uniref:Aldehyde dehydrogenase n=1 Tax=Dokdonia pacifica TaxID=1627892 RepID=A0A239B3U9_9FLAO|nr:aldehyde dehydrogenase [Dokdonia pacifica]GGG33278.1 aldehyde dehydrogenase [Dokdonia pacifica]SNS02500.1 aldehyde dehydrogenase (NAD+) [Dokdonia pacifica]